MTTDAPAPADVPAPIAAIDVGSNTTRLLVARVTTDGVEPVARGSAMTALGAGLRAGGGIPPEGLDLVAETVGRMADEARSLGARRIVVACTAPGRTAANAAELLERLERAAGAPARVLSGAEEAGLSFRGMVAAGAPDPLLAVDLGGGSLELMGGEGGRLRWATSLPIGARSLTERFAPADPPSVDLLEPMIAAVRVLVESVELPVAVGEAAAGGDALATGGSAVAVGRLAGAARLDGEALRRAVERLVATPAESLAEATGLEPARVRLSLAGAAALEAARRTFGLGALIVSEAGLGEGLVLEAAA